MYLALTSIQQNCITRFLDAVDLGSAPALPLRPTIVDGHDHANTTALLAIQNAGSSEQAPVAAEVDAAVLSQRRRHTTLHCEYLLGQQYRRQGRLPQLIAIFAIN